MQWEWGKYSSEALLSFTAAKGEQEQIRWEWLRFAEETDQPEYWLYREEKSPQRIAIQSENVCYSCNENEDLPSSPPPTLESVFVKFTLVA